MTPETILWEALQRSTPEERQAYLATACAHDPALWQRLQALVAAHERDPAFLQQPAAAPLTTTIAGSAEQPGHWIGPYHLLQKLGEGGMGTVWVAEQQQPVKRRVALKLIKAGMDSRELLRRFEAERQALAMMEHHHIARVFDAGCAAVRTADEPEAQAAIRPGRPYFVMELVKGVPITTYCDEVQADLAQRLSLFLQVCSAVQHAHHKGIIHRDIKPSNVLVAMHDGQPVPKVIDFGVAKALYTNLAQATHYTEIGQIIGTLEYMAPEQAELSAMDIDTRADIYGLGVLLYELLTGSTPLTRERLKTAAMAEVLRLIKEEEPPRPSTRLSGSNASLASLAARRRSDPRRLSSELKGELDWVVLKALEKDRTRRYDSAGGLARDIERYLAHEVVEARPPSWSYRFRKWSRRHRGLLTAISAIWVITLVLLGYAFRQQAIANDERRRAENERVEAIQARHAAIDAQEQMAQSMLELNRAKLDAIKKGKLAEDEKNHAEAVLHFLQNDLLRQANPHEQRDAKKAPDPNVKMRDLLDRAASSMGTRFADQPILHARLRATLGETYAGLGLHREAERHLQAALDLYRRHQEVLRSTFTNRSYFREYLEWRMTQARSLEALGQPVSDQVIMDEMNSVWRNFPLSPVDSQLLQTLSDYLKKPPTSAGKMVDYLEQLAQSQLGNKPELAKEMAATLQPARDFAAGNYTATEKYARDQIAAARATEGELSLDAFNWLRVIAFLQQKQGKTDEALQTLQSLWPKYEPALGAEHLKMIEVRHELGRLLLKRGEWKSAEEHLRAALSHYQKEGKQHQVLYGLHFDLARIAAKTAAQDNEAETHLLQAHHHLTQLPKPLKPIDQQNLRTTVDAIIRFYEQMDKPEEARHWQGVKGAPGK